MSSLVIKNLNDAIVEQGKRTHIPVIATSLCPKCEKPATKDLMVDYLSYPDTNTPIHLNFACECEAEWTHKVILRMTLEEVYEQTTNPAST